MYQFSCKERIRYAETDKMGYCYYGNYARFFEIGRVESLRNLGNSYKDLEEFGIMLPVLEYKVKYIKPALYDDQIEITTFIKKLPEARIVFDYEIHNQEDILIAKAETTLVFVDANTMKPTRAPESLLNQLKKHISNE